MQVTILFQLILVYLLSIFHFILSTSLLWIILDYFLPPGHSSLFPTTFLIEKDWRKGLD